MTDLASDSDSDGARTPSFHLPDTDSEVIVAKHHLPPNMAGYVFVRHLRSAISHDTFLAYRQQHTDAGAATSSEAKALRRISSTSGKANSGSRSRSGSHTEDATKEEVNRDYVVIRVIAHAYLKRDLERRQMVERDALVARLVDHPCLAVSLPSFSTATDLFLVQRYYKGGELYEVMESYAESVAAATVEAPTPGTAAHHRSKSAVGAGQYGLPESIAKRLARELLQALSYLHNDCGLAHRNLKLENVLLDADNHVHLCGFGMCAVLPARRAGASSEAVESPASLKLCCGSKHYVAPELVRGEVYDGCAVDVWAAGVILFALLTGAFPFDDEDGLDETVFRKIRQAGKVLEANPLFCGLADPMAQDILRSMLRVDPAARCDVAEALEHPFFTN